MDKRRLEIINGDALEKLKEIPSESIDLIITDPPYNLNKDYGKNKDNLEFEEYLNFSKKWLNEAKRVLKKRWNNMCFYGHALHIIYLQYTRTRFRYVF